MFSDGLRDDGRSPILGIIPLRVGAGVLLAYMHAWPDGVLAWQHVWNRQPWGVAATLESAGLTPFMASLLGGLAAAVTVLAAVSWILGFLTRLSALLFMPVTLGTLWVCNRVEMPFRAEVAVLYFLVTVTLFVTGSGWLSVDTLFQRSRERSSGSNLFL